MYSFLKSIYESKNRALAFLFRKIVSLIGIGIGPNLEIRGIPHVFSRTPGNISIGKGCKLYSTPTSNPVGINHKCIIRTLVPSATITIGDNVGMSGVTILSRMKITVEDNVLFGANCTVTDSDHHPMNPSDRIRNRSDSIQEAPVTICKNVWLGMNVIVFKGVTIGENTVVGAGSVVSKSLPPNVLAVGNPAKVVKNI